MGLKGTRKVGPAKSFMMWTSETIIIHVIKSRRLGLSGREGRMGEKRGAERVLAGKSREKRPLGIFSRRKEHIKKDF